MDDVFGLLLAVAAAFILGWAAGNIGTKDNIENDCQRVGAWHRAERVYNCTERAK